MLIATLVAIACPAVCASISQHVLQDAPSRAVSPALFSDLERASRLADIAYCVNPPTTDISRPFRCLSRCAEFPSFELVSSWNSGLLMTSCAGYLALDHDRHDIILSFRGTYSISNTIIDLSTIPQEYTPYPGEDDDPDGPQDKCNNCSVHIGFNTAWRTMRDRVLSEMAQIKIFHPKYTTTIIGHSLGGAVAALAALDLQAREYDPLVTTFGEPRVGNQGLADFIDDHFDLNNDDIEPDDKRFRRVTHIDDPVPLLPLSEWGFRMHGGEIFIDKLALSPDIQDVQHCVGDADPQCIASQDTTTQPDADASRVRKALLPSVKNEIADILSEPWGIPSRYKLWQLITSHRDYFHRIGVCMVGGDPFGGGHEYPNTTASTE